LEENESITSNAIEKPPSNLNGAWAWKSPWNFAQIVFHYIQNAMHYFHLFHRISNELGDPVRQELAHAANIGKMSDPPLGLQMPEKLGPSFNTVKLRAQYSQYPF
jgi:hypothetical protein